MQMADAMDQYRMVSKDSPFFNPPPTAQADSLAILQLSRHNLLPVNLRANADDGYAEGAVTNTRFGSYPHSTFIGAEWGSQIRASKVDTGTRGRKGKHAKRDATASPLDSTQQVLGQEGPKESKKRKSDGQLSGQLESPTKKTKPSPSESKPAPPKAAVEAGSGFTHVLQPTPESWTYSLDHRTQVVYTPDYSYILQKLRTKPGSTIIEAGAGSGSFTHAAARAVFNGHSKHDASSGKLRGKVCSFEYHEPRVETLKREIHDHGLQDVVELAHRDVYNDGFLLADGTSPKASAIFLDLPAPWVALKHLTREDLNTPLDPDSTAHICTFSPCIEQVMSTVSALRKAGWTDIQMVEVQNKRIDVRRERVGLKEEGLRGVNANAATVAESIERLREVEAKLNDFHATKNSSDGAKVEKRIPTKAERLEQIRNELESRKLFKEGNLVHRTESEVKTHTSYLVFAVLPKQWTEENEKAAAAEWDVERIMATPGIKAAAPA